MNDYRPLTSEEIEALKKNGCWAEDWTSVNVAEDFETDRLSQVRMYGEVNIGSLCGDLEITEDFYCPCGIRNATLRNVTVGDLCLIENVGVYIANYVIGDSCHIANIGKMEWNHGEGCGEGDAISVLNEAGKGNVTLFCELTSQLAAFMVRHDADLDLKRKLKQLIEENIAKRVNVDQSHEFEWGIIGNNVIITNTKEITNCTVYDECEVENATALRYCTLGSIYGEVNIGDDVCLDNCIIDQNANIASGARLCNCFVGEACTISNGFTATSSLFFANSEMHCGEACAAFCGPFSASHHKSSLLIGGMFSFYNAGSATNFSNHAYKMGPLHGGELQRGSKTASGSYLFLPARIGAFSVVLGKVMSHPDTSHMPFSYIYGEGNRTVIIPGRSFASYGFYRDIHKWPERDMRPTEHRQNIINHDWLSPYSLQGILQSMRILQQLRDTQGGEVAEYAWQGMYIPRKALDNGIRFYDAIIKMFLAKALDEGKEHAAYDEDYAPYSTFAQSDAEPWSDLAGLLLPTRLEESIACRIKSGELTSIEQIGEEMKRANDSYHDYLYAYAYRLILDRYATDNITDCMVEEVVRQGREAKTFWLSLMEQDIEKEYALGDVEESVYKEHIGRIRHEREKIENMGS